MPKLTPYAGVLLAAFFVQAGSAQALTQKECSAKFNAAKSAGTLNGMNWNAFRKAQCGPGAQAANNAAPAGNSNPGNNNANTAANNASPNASRNSSRKILNSAAAAGTHANGNVVFPSRVAAKYANETPGKARMQTCLDQYNANKASGGNAGLKWIEKGGGYYSQCNAKLKG